MKAAESPSDDHEMYFVHDLTTGNKINKVWLKRNSQVVENALNKFL